MEALVPGISTAAGQRRFRLRRGSSGHHAQMGQTAADRWVTESARVVQVESSAARPPICETPNWCSAQRMIHLRHRVRRDHCRCGLDALTICGLRRAWVEALTAFKNDSEVGRGTATPPATPPTYLPAMPPTSSPKDSGFVIYDSHPIAVSYGKHVWA